MRDKLQSLCHQCYKDVLGSTEACDFNCSVLFSGVFIHHSVLYLNNACLLTPGIMSVEAGSMVFEVLGMGTVLSPSLSAALHMASVVVGASRRAEGAGEG